MLKTLRKLRRFTVRAFSLANYFGSFDSSSFNRAKLCYFSLVAADATFVPIACAIICCSGLQESLLDFPTEFESAPYALEAVPRFGAGSAGMTQQVWTRLSC